MDREKKSVKDMKNGGQKSFPLSTIIYNMGKATSKDQQTNRKVSLS